MVRFLSLLFLIGTVQGQAIYCGLDNGLSSKVTLSNLALYSEQFDNVAWTKSSITITADSITAPDGTLTAELATLTASTSSGRYCYPASVISVGNQSVRRESIYLKKGTHNFVHWYSQYPNTAFVDVDLDAGTILRGGSTNLTSTMKGVGNGWYWVSFTHTPNNNNASPTFHPLKDATTLADTSWTSTTAMTFYVWGASVNLASDPSDYLATTTAAATLGPLCGSMQTQSALDPSQCITMTNRGREIRTEAQIAIGSQ